MPKHAEDARARAEARFRKQYEDNQVADQARADREAQAHAVEVKRTGSDRFGWPRKQLTSRLTALLPRKQKG